MPTRWCAAWSGCRTAPARRFASASSRAAPKAEEAQAAGADVVGAEDLAAAVQEGRIEFDRCIATPDMMALVGRLGKILGPRGLMPNPRLGTVTMDVRGAVGGGQGGPGGVPRREGGHRPCRHRQGRPSTTTKLLENARAFVDAIQRAKPTGRQGHLSEEGRRQLLHGAGGEGRRRVAGRSGGRRRRVELRNSPARGGQAGRVRAAPATRARNLSETARGLRGSPWP